MDKQLLSTLEEWIAQSDPDAWLQAHPEHMGALSPYRDLAGTLRSNARAYCMISEPSGAAIATGEARIMAAVQGKAPPTGLRHWSAPARAGAMVAVAVVALTLATGASALTGGGFGQAVLDAVSGPSDHDEGINNAPDSADNGRDHANDNAFEGSGNADDNALNGNGCQSGDTSALDANQNANPNAGERCDNASDGIGNAGDIPGAGADNATGQASPGSGNAPESPGSQNGQGQTSQNNHGSPPQDGQ